ncbi:MAG: hypothetical protein Q9N34_10700 [Aquificota bacterium]|nr:hypothetical protein [Aquificota bacterium]
MFPKAKKEELKLSYYLVKPLMDDGLEVEESELRLREPDMERLRKRLTELEMRSILKDLDKLLKTRTQGSLF